MPPSLPMNAPRGRDEQWLSVTKPTATTRFFRTFLPWQLLRFVVINLKMMRIGCLLQAGLLRLRSK